ncbi:hypothetical protein GCM10011362_08260 [Marinobacter halophilus]|uniref:Uncharacterized protein n=1 Tax=Marinobacter halophilus TaxID=1323740 RepID=A0A2T1KGD5_9GAMM|nr:hypothetical protein C7H08_08005 [Marinobacter halophilus]GGC62094.1 hypothetical protein GCM10011362_08260 [Marinobacter halophilus]
MSIARILQTMGIESVPHVPPTQVAEGTGKAPIDHKCSPCSPCSLEKLRGPDKKGALEYQEVWQTEQPANPDALLFELAQTLQASPARLRALLSEDDMQDIAEGATSRSHLLAYFRLMRSDGKQLADDQPAPTRARDSRSDYIQRMQAWKPAHDAMINHIMACQRCYPPRNRYCSEGARLRGDYHTSCEQPVVSPEPPRSLPNPNK